MEKKYQTQLANVVKGGQRPSQTLINAAFAEKLRELDQNAGNFNMTDYRHGVSGASRTKPGRFKGGVLESESASFPDDAQAGDEIIVEWQGDNFARMLGTTLHKFTCAAYGDLVAEAAKVSVTMLVNGESVNQLNDAPLSSVIQTVDGLAMFVTPKVLVPEYANISLRFKCEKNLTGVAGQTTELYGIAYCDSSAGEEIE